VGLQRIVAVVAGSALDHCSFDAHFASGRHKFVNKIGELLTVSNFTGDNVRGLAIVIRRQNRFESVREGARAGLLQHPAAIHIGLQCFCCDRLSRFASVSVWLARNLRENVIAITCRMMGLPLNCGNRKLYALDIQLG